MDVLLFCVGFFIGIPLIASTVPLVQWLYYTRKWKKEAEELEQNGL